MKITLSLIYSGLISLMALFQAYIAPNALWVALLFGAVMGMFARIALDVSKHGKKHLNRVLFESLATVCLITACGLFALEIVLHYFDIKKKIEAGTLSAEFPAYLSACSSCLLTLTGRDGLFFIRDVAKSVLGNWIKKENER